jgi:hypothetical protein
MSDGLHKNCLWKENGMACNAVYPVTRQNYTRSKYCPKHSALVRQERIKELHRRYAQDHRTLVAKLRQTADEIGAYGGVTCQSTGLPIYNPLWCGIETGETK